MCISAEMFSGKLANVSFFDSRMWFLVSFLVLGHVQTSSDLLHKCLSGRRSRNLVWDSSDAQETETFLLWANSNRVYFQSNVSLALVCLRLIWGLFRACWSNTSSVFFPHLVKYLRWLMTETLVVLGVKQKSVLMKTIIVRWRVEALLSFFS